MDFRLHPLPFAAVSAAFPSGHAALACVDTDIIPTQALQLEVRGSVHHSTIHKKKIQQDATMYQNFIIPYL